MQNRKKCKIGNRKYKIQYTKKKKTVKPFNSADELPPLNKNTILQSW